VKTIRCSLPVSFHALRTSVSETVRASIRNVPLVISVARAGSSARMSRVGTEPWPLPTICGRAARSAAAGMAAVGPATEPIWIQVSGRVLAILRDREPKMAEPAGFLGLDRSSVSGLIDRAVRRGLVRRDTSSDDGRPVRVSLTLDGQRIGRLLTDEISDLITPMTRNLGAADQKRLGALLQVLPPRDGTSSQAVALISSATLLTLLLGIVAALGVFNTVVLNARERRRDLGMLRSIGMTPRQVTVMMMTSMGGLGLVGGLIGVPLGVVAHHVVAPAMMRAAQSDVFDFVLHVYHAPMVALLALAGIAIAVLGALIPSRAAARIPIAEVLHNE
jgi:DNA-binding MarR family transcriptional regulator